MGMAKYADITPFYEWIEWLEKESNTKCPEYETLMFYEIIDKLDSLPEVVRGKDCLYFSIDEGDFRGICRCGKIAVSYSGEIYPKETDFCSYGERREENAAD